MRKPHGFGQIIGDPAHSFGMAEHDMVTCIHCGGISMSRSSVTGKLEVLIMRVDGTHYMKECGTCRSCMEVICPRCVGKPCNNRWRRMEAEEKAAAKAAANLLAFPGRAN